MRDESLWDGGWTFQRIANYHFGNLIFKDQLFLSKTQCCFKSRYKYRILVIISLIKNNTINRGMMGFKFLNIFFIYANDCKYGLGVKNEEVVSRIILQLC